MIGRRPGLVLVPALALVLAGCDAWPEEPPADQYDYVSVCTNTAGDRVEDDKCDPTPDDWNDGSTSMSFVWFYVPTTGGLSAPPVGHRVDRSIGTYRPPTALPGGKAPSMARAGSVNPAGGAVQRGGFGVSGGGKAGSSGGGKSGAGS